MATYKGIQGFTIQNLSADPSNPIEGQVWYNSTSNVWKVEEATAVGAWATGGNLATARGKNAGVGPQTAALCASGYFSPPGQITAGTEEYDGSAWTAGGSLGTARYGAATSGTQTSAAYFGGAIDTNATPTTATEEYNGTSFSGGGNMNQSRYQFAGFGTQTAAVGVGGYTSGTPAPGSKANVEHYDGSTWTNATALPTATGFCTGSAGTQTAGLLFGGNYSSNRRIYRCRSSSNKNNYSKLTGGKYGNKNIHRS
jgi:hypothetical protein